MNISWNRWSRKLHRWGAFIACLPLLLVISTGLLLQVKKQVDWVQPSTQTGTGQVPQLAFDRILAVCRKVPEAQIDDWQDIDRLDVRPSRGLVKVQCKNRWEIQIDFQTGDVLSSTYRRSDLIESLHDGSFFSDFAKLWLFLPNGLVLLGLWFSGMYLWWLPINAKRKKKKKSESAL
jgi:uncharacterized iron-regulated membrane protein